MNHAKPVFVGLYSGSEFGDQLVAAPETLVPTRPED